MLMLYNSENYAVVQFDFSSADAPPDSLLERGGYEIVDKFARREIFLEGAVAQVFKEGVEALVQGSPSEEEIDLYLGRFTAVMQQPVVLH